jgi:predicted Zn-dependent peptidase
MPLKHTVTEVKLKNGAKGLIIDVPGTTVVSYQFQFRAGNDYVMDPKKQQAAHIMEHMVFGANKQYPSTEAFSQDFTKNGAYYNASTGDRDMIYYSTAALMEWDRILDLQSLAITDPIFQDKLLKVEKANVHEELVGYLSNDGRALYIDLLRAMGDPSLTDAECDTTLANVTVDDIIAHHSGTHTTRNMRFIIVGDLAKHHDKIIERLEAWQLPKGELLPARQVLLHGAAPVSLYRKDNANIRFRFTIALPRRLSEAELDAMGALNHILNGTFHSRMFGQARTLGLCYGMNSSTSTDISGTSRWSFYGQVGDANATQLFELIATQLKKVIAGDVSQDELDEAKQYALGSYQMKGQTVYDMANWYTDYFEDDSIHYMEDAPQMITSTKLSIMKDLSREFIENGDWALGGIGNMEPSKIDELQAILAKVLKQEVK